tara:strand:- start:8469 stop:9104 length:636 start_codon:yes stop_codon:yes gene_type:complete
LGRFRKIEMKKKILLIGSGGHARVVIDALERLDYDLKGIIDLNYKKSKELILGYKVIGNYEKLKKFKPKDYFVFIAIGDNQIRKKYFNKVKKRGFKIPNIVHPSSNVSKHVSLGKGIFINIKAIINASARIKDNTIINTASIIEHETVIGKNCHICPGAKIAGRVLIGDDTFIGLGTNIIQNVKIGKNTKVGAGLTVKKNIKKNTTFSINK